MDYIIDLLRENPIIPIFLTLGVMVALSCATKIMGYDTGEALGLYAGAETALASLGVIGETVKGLDIVDTQKEALYNITIKRYEKEVIIGSHHSNYGLIDSCG